LPCGDEHRGAKTGHIVAQTPPFWQVLFFKNFKFSITHSFFNASKITLLPNFTPTKQKLRTKILTFSPPPSKRQNQPQPPQNLEITAF
jgi:hypothetical protein